MKERLIAEIVEMLRSADIMELEAVRNVLIRLTKSNIRSIVGCAGGEVYEGEDPGPHRRGRTE